MRRILSVILALLCLIPSCALAAGEATVTQTAFYSLPLLTYWQGCIYAEITNTGDAPVELTGGTYELFGQDGSVIDSGNVYSYYPKILAPGEIGFAIVEKGIQDAASADHIAGGSVQITGKASSEQLRSLPCTAVQELRGDLIKMPYAICTVTNDTAEMTGGDIGSVIAAYFADGSLAWAAYASSLGIDLHPGSTIDIRALMDEDLLSAAPDIDHYYARAW